MVLEGVPKKEIPKRLWICIKDLKDVLMLKTSFKIYLAEHYPNLIKVKFREGENLRWKGKKFKIPKAYALPENPVEVYSKLAGIQSIPECKVELGDVVFDVGAYYGCFSYYALEQGAREVYLFEPNPYVFEILKKNCEIWGDRLKPFQIALCNSKGTIELYIAKKTGYESTILSENQRKNTLHKNFGYTEKILVPSTTIDDFVREMNIEKVDFIKINAEGAEKFVIYGAKKTIKEFKPKMVIAAHHSPNDKFEIQKIVLSIEPSEIPQLDR